MQMPKPHPYGNLTEPFFLEVHSHLQTG